jgi:hypothetical protein
VSQPTPPTTRQSGPEAKKTSKDAIHQFAPGGKPGGPILPGAQGYVNPGPTDNLRGVEPNTAMHRGQPNPEQHGTPGHIGGADHNPGMAQAGQVHGHGVNTASPAKERTSDKSKKVAPPMPDPRGVRK